MDDIEWKNKLTSFLRRYKYVIGVCLIGVILMLLPEPKSSEAPEENAVQSILQEDNVAKRLADILKKVRGAGDVEVMLTVAAGEQTIYQTDSIGNASSNPGSLQIETILITSSDKDQTGLVKQVLPEVYLGAIVICQGADDPSVRLAIIEAVADVTGLSTDKISVLRMK